MNWSVTVVGCFQFPAAPQEFQYIELFSGVGNVFAETRSAKYAGVACDIVYGEAFGFDPKSNGFDFMGAAGFAFWT